ncbi:chromosome transmission fidelity protein 18 [Anaeramoeba flamelloides]|uniref:Chromosome transmission fidelity protein 18 n=1 Tax=Anaeramoeba flamelloides TaxID=1746091 RepID=A0AAV7Y9R9_9EUKA|nr:chromosome transmission fidelity protein 18 [Anaeramoeba flamelloides]
MSELHSVKRKRKTKTKQNQIPTFSIKVSNSNEEQVLEETLSQQPFEEQSFEDELLEEEEEEEEEEKKMKKNEQRKEQAKATNKNKYPKYYQYKPSTFPSFKIKQSDGNIVYAKDLSGNQNEAVFLKNDLTKLNEEMLLEEPIEDILERARTLSIEKQKIRKIKQEYYQQNKKKEINNEMWTSKYQPKRYFDLISNETTNREILGWLMSWKNKKKQPKQKQKQQQPQQQQFRNFQNNSNNNNNNNNNKRFNRSKFKYRYNLNKDSNILLVSGAAGIGKTSVVQILAKHCGFDLIEINASDERSNNMFKNRIKAALGQQSLPGQKPLCFLFDEIDGSISSKSTPRSRSRSNQKSKPIASSFFSPLNQNSRSRGKQNRNSRKPQSQSQSDENGINYLISNIKKLRSPVICVCNELYTLALRRLRRASYVIKMKPPETSDILKRLDEICAKEKIETTNEFLVEIVNKNNNDIRGCLRTLEFLSRNPPNFFKFRSDNIYGKSKKNKKINLKEITLDNYQKITIDRDYSRNLFETIEYVFNRNKDLTSKTQQSSLISNGGSSGGSGSGNAFGNNGENRQGSTQRKRKSNQIIESLNQTQSYAGKIQKFWRSFKIIKEFNNDDFLLNSIFNNFLNLDYPDIFLHKTSNISDWFVFNDLVIATRNKTMDFSLNKYLPFPILAIGKDCQRIGNDIRFDLASMNKQRQKLKQNIEICNSFLENIPQKLKSSSINMKVLATELAPYLSRMINPAPLANFTIKNNYDRQKLIDKITKIHFNYSLSYISEEGFTGQMQYTLSPQIDLVGRFPSLPSYKTLSTRILNSLFTKLENKEEIKKTESHFTKKKYNKKNKFNGTTFLSELANRKKSKLKINVIIPDVVFRFHEGFTNAVRIPLSISSLL